MYTDIVYGGEEEEKFIELARVLGFDSICFLYDEQNKKEAIQRVQSLRKKTGFEISYAFLSLGKSNNTKKDKIFFQNNKSTRGIIEQKKANVIFSFENQNREDFIHHRASGLNQVLCSLLKEKKIAAGFSFNDLLNAGEKRRKTIGRMIQNISLCSKYEVNTLIASFARYPHEMRAIKDVFSLFSILGMQKDKIKESFSYKFNNT